VDDHAARELVGRVEHLLDGADERTLETVAAVVGMYGEGLARVMALAGDGEREALARDELVGHLLMLHDLHPVPVEDRVRNAVAAAGGGAGLVGIEDGVVRLRPSGGGCDSSPTKQQAIEDKIARAAPDVDRVEFVDDPPRVPKPVVVLPQVGAR
jgi:Fe-S cluster biogenesis protein NfuA